MDLTANHKDSWYLLFLEDIRWVLSFLGEAAQAPREPRGWIQMVRESPQSYKRLISEAFSAHARWWADQCHLRQWQARLRSLCQAAAFPPPRTCLPPERAVAYPCYECDHVAHTPGAWRSHRTKEHPSTDLAGSLVGPGGVCHTCLRDFHTRPRLLDIFGTARKHVSKG